MTRVTSNVHSSSSRQQQQRSSRSNASNQTRTFKKRAPLSSLSSNQRRSGNGSNNSKNPFASFQPNKSGIILQDDNEKGDELSDFSHFLSAEMETNNQNNQAFNETNSNSPKQKFHKNAALKRKKQKESSDEFIFGELRRFNSMTVPFKERRNHKNKNNVQQHAKSNENVQNIHSISKRFSLNYIPLDLSLKKSLYFISDASLKWCSSIPLKLRNAALHQQNLCNLSPLEQKQYKFYKNMLFYQYPHNQWSQSQLTVLHKFYLANSSKLQTLQKMNTHKKKDDFSSFVGQSNMNDGNDEYGKFIYNEFVERNHEWMQSFHSLYSLFRHGNIDYFYIHFASFFNIVFCVDHKNEEKEKKVIITNTHQSFRNNLKRHNIPFTTPLIEINDEDKENENILLNDDDDGDSEIMDVEELQRNGTHIRKNNGKRKENQLGFGHNGKNKERTVTLICGNQNVHFFYDFLINYMHRICLSIKKCHDVPLIFCDKPFLNAKVCLLKMSKNLSGLNEKKERMFTMQLDGIIMPNMYRSVMKLLIGKQNTTVSSKLFDLMWHGMNYCFKSEPFRKLKDVESRDFDFVQKMQVNDKDKSCVVHLQR